MLKALKKNLWSVICAFWALVVALFWTAMRVIWSGISKVIADTFGVGDPTKFLLDLPLYICILLWVIFALSVASLVLLRDKKWPKVTLTAVLGAFTIASIVVVVMGAIDYLYFILPKFGLSLLVSLCIVTFALLLFFPPVKNCKLCLSLKCLCVALAILLGVVGGFGITIGSKFTHGAVVYAVEDTYQIVFSTNHSATAWVEIDGEKYYDLFAGSMKSNDTVHKIVVPQQELDQAKSYTICAEKMHYRGPFGGFKGKVISQNYTFRPVDSSDGLVYYTMSDVHHARKGAVDAAPKRY